MYAAITGLAVMLAVHVEDKPVPPNGEGTPDQTPGPEIQKVK